MRECISYLFLIMIMLMSSTVIVIAEKEGLTIVTTKICQDLEADECFIPVRRSDGRLETVLRHDLELWEIGMTDESADERDARILHRIASLATEGPTKEERAKGYMSALPAGTVIEEVRVSGQKGGFFITLPDWYLTELTDETAQELVDLFVRLDFHIPRIRDHVLMVRSPHDHLFYTIDRFLVALPPVSLKSSETERRDKRPGKATGNPPWTGQGQPSGYLSGKSIFVNPGHGWYYNADSLYRWATQRGNTNNIIEDLSNAESVNYFLVPYLWNAGAGVYTCRERDMNTSRVIVDNSSNGYSETGTWTTITNSSAWNGNYRRALTASSTTATATFRPEIPASGYYHVSIWYVGSSLFASDSQITIRHTGGETTVTHNFEHDGSTFKYIGRYYFNAGSDQATGSVTVSNQSSELSNYVVADAVRFGGGTGVETPFSEPMPSDWPRYEEAGPYHAAYMGCGSCGSGTVVAMPRYAAWESESWEDSIYISWHSNCCDNTGTSSWAYASGGWDEPFDGIEGGIELRNAIHAELINDLQAGFNSSWGNRGLHTAWFGELNPSYNPEMPAALFEMAYHDVASDALALQDPIFRNIAARAVYQGIVKYFADRDNDPNYTLLPEPPTGLRIVNNGPDEVLIAWKAPIYDTGAGLYGHAATGYKVYRSTDGFGFDNGRTVSDGATTSYTDTAVAAGHVYYYRVSATNSGGESFPTETLGLRTTVGPAAILVVSGFNRIDHHLSVVTDDPYSTSDLHRGYLEMMNSYRYIIPFARALDASLAAFDSCNNEAIIDGIMTLTDYPIVFWFCGEESRVDRSFNATEQTCVSAYLDGGGSLFVSGSEIGYDLVINGLTFYQNYLKADYLGDDSDTYEVTPVSGSIFDGNTPFCFDDNSQGEYNANYPDQLGEIGGSQQCLLYSGGSGGIAGIQYSGVFNIVNFGFPFETITSEASRNEIVADILAFFGGGAPPGPCSGAIDIPSLPYSDSNTTIGKAARMNWYSCAPTTNEAGPEVIYRLVLDQPGSLTVAVTDPSGVDIDPHLLSACSVDSCLARHDSTFTIGATPGTYYIVCDTWTDSGGTQYPGSYTLNVSFVPAPGDTIAPATITDLCWDDGPGRWTWSEVTADRLGSPESTALYRVYRSSDVTAIDSLLQTTISPFMPDPDEPPAGCWYYDVKAVDSAGNEADAPLDILIDNTAAFFAGDWSTGTIQPGHWHDDYRYHPTGGDGSHKATWSHIMRERGRYTVSIYYPAGNNHSTASPFTITHAGGLDIIKVNQRNNGGTWLNLGEFWFDIDTIAIVDLDDSAWTWTGDYVLADAVRWTKVP